MSSQQSGQVGIKGIAEVVPGKGALPTVRISGKDRPRGEICLHGGHITSWRPHGEEILWLSSQSWWQPEKPIRGGVPICFPWFGPNKSNNQLPAHGFARVHPWRLETVEKAGPDGADTTVTLSLVHNFDTRPLWPHDFLLRHRVTFGNELVMALELTNTGQNPFTAELAAHTYFAVKDIRQARVEGLAGAKYIDKVDGLKIKDQSGDVTFSGETDRVYLNSPGPLSVIDPVKNRRILITRENSKNAVVWNPWIDKAKAMPDFGDDEWPAMVCVESANVGEDALTVAPGQTQTMTTRIKLEGI